MDPGKPRDGLIPPAHFHQPSGAFVRRQNHQSKQNRRYNAGEKHPAPTSGYIPRFIAHALNEHVDEDGSENSNHNAELVEGHTAAANLRGSDLCNVIRRNHRRRADPQSANQPPENELMAIAGKRLSNTAEREPYAA